MLVDLASVYSVVGRVRDHRIHGAHRTQGRRETLGNPL